MDTEAIGVRSYRSANIVNKSPVEYILTQHVSYGERCIMRVSSRRVSRLDSPLLTMTKPLVSGQDETEAIALYIMVRSGSISTHCSGTVAVIKVAQRNARTATPKSVALSNVC